MSFTRRLSWLIVAAALLAPAVAPGGAAAQEEGWSVNVNGFLGGKGLDDDDWDPVEGQAELGVEFDFRPPRWPLGFAVGLRASSAADEEGILDTEGSTSELSLGLKKVWEPRGSSVRPFVGGGLAAVHAAVDRETLAGHQEDDDGALGFYLQGGVFWTLRESFNIGFEVRYSEAEVTLFGRDVEAGGGHLGLLVGAHW